jgi:hypothetical protein
MEVKAVSVDEPGFRTSRRLISHLNSSPVRPKTVEIKNGHVRAHYHYCGGFAMPDIGARLYFCTRLAIHQGSANIMAGNPLRSES